MSKQGKQTSVSFVIPHLDLVIISSGHEERLCDVEVDAPDGPVMLVEAVDECPHPVVPQLDDAAVEAGEDPWPLAVEAEALDSVALGLELCQHRVRSSTSPSACSRGGAGSETRNTGVLDPRAFPRGGSQLARRSGGGSGSEIWR